MAEENKLRSLAPFNKDYSWQERAVETFFQRTEEFYSIDKGKVQRAYVVEVSPSGGKTIFSMKLARQLIADDLIDRVIWCVPRDSIKLGFEDDVRVVPEMPDAYRLIEDRHFRIDTGLTSNYAGQLRNYHGAVITYQALPRMLEYFDLLAHKHRLMFVFDETHHGSTGHDDEAVNTWGNAMQQCGRFANAVVCMTGTPLRSDAKRVPFLRYREIKAADDFGERRGYQVEPDFSFSYSDAVAAGVARRITLRNQDPEIEYEVQAPDGATENHVRPVSAIPIGHLNKVKNTAFCFRRGVVDDLLKIAYEESELHRSATGGADRDAAVLVIGKRDTDGAENTLENIAQRIQVLFGEFAVTVESADGPQCRRKILEFKRGTSRWIVAKEMISEGTNIPRMRTIVILRDIGNRTFYEQLVHRVTRNDADDRPQDAIIVQLQLPHLYEWGLDLEQQARIGWNKAKREPTGEGPGADGGQPTIDGICATLSEEFVAIAGNDFTDVDPLARRLHNEVGDKTHTSRWQTNFILKGLGKLGIRLDGESVPQDGQPFTIEEQFKRRKDNANKLIRKAAINLGRKEQHFKTLTWQCKKSAGIKGKLDNVLRDHPDPMAAIIRYEKAAKRALELSNQQRRLL